MAKIQCPYCRKPIDENIEYCSFCGKSLDVDTIKLSKEKQKKRNKRIWIFVAISIAFFTIVMFIPSDGSSSSSSTAQTKEVVTNSSLDSSVSQVKVWMRSNLKDPDSLEYLEWSAVQKTNTGDYRVRVKYRAKNSFNAVVIENKLFTLDSNGVVIDVVDYH